MENTTAFSGIGLSNVDSRIKMLFGNDYGLYIDSIYQIYTTVEIVLTEYKRRREAL
jgi:two-component system sensor histidine kinase YesM